MDIDIQTIIFIATGIVTGASLILKAIKDITKTEFDNKLYKALIGVLEFLSLATKKPEQKVEIVIKE